MDNNEENIEDNNDLQDMFKKEHKNFSKEIDGEIIFSSTDTKQKTTIVFDTKRSS